MILLSKRLSDLYDDPHLATCTYVIRIRAWKLIFHPDQGLRVFSKVFHLTFDFPQNSIITELEYLPSIQVDYKSQSATAGGSMPWVIQ